MQVVMNAVIGFFRSIFSARNITLRNFTLFILVLMTIQYIPLESRAGVSPIKVAMMAIVPFVLIKYIKITKATIIIAGYFLYILLTAGIIHTESFRASTVFYLLMFLITYMAFYQFVWIEKVLSLSFFISFVRNFIFVLVGVLIVQQCFIVIGIKQVPLINLCQVFDRGIGANSLTFEPSSLARILGVLYYAYLKCCEYRQGHSVHILEIFGSEHRIVTLSFLWAMLTMGSGTAFICLGFLSLYFMKGFYTIIAIPVFVGVYFVLTFFQVEQFQRAQGVVDATMTGDVNVVLKEDRSAGMRLKPMMHTLSLDLYDFESWVGWGCDSARKSGQYGDLRYLGQIGDYGIISYLIELVLIFSCSISFFSLPTLMLFAGIGGGISNISYGWGMLMILSCVKYFHDNYQPSCNDTQEVIR